MKKRELQLLYNGMKNTDQEARALLKTMKNYIINEFDIQYNKLTPRQLSLLAKCLNVNVDDLFDKQSDKYHPKMASIPDEDKLVILNGEMSFLKTPIIMREDGMASFLRVPTALPSKL